MRLNDGGLKLLGKFQTFDRAADKAQGDRFYFCTFPEGAVGAEAFSLTGFGFQDANDAEARKAFLVALASALHKVLVEEGLVPDRTGGETKETDVSEGEQ